MSVLLRRVLFPLVLGGVVLLGCDRPDPSPSGSEDVIVPIGSLSQPIDDPGRTIRLQGQVVTVVPLMGSSAYLLKDETGEIWVLDPSGSSPLVGESMRLEGHLEVERIPDIAGDRPEVYVRQQQQL